MEKIKKNTNGIKYEDGFSLIELVVAVGILALLSIVGTVAYNGLIKQARTAAVTNAAATVYNGAMVYETDNLPETTFQTAVDEWNKSAGVELPESIATINIVAGIGVNEKKIVVEGTRLENNAFEIKSTYGSEGSSDKIEIVKRSPDAKSLENEDNTKEEKKTYAWGDASFKCESKDREKDRDGYEVFTHEVIIPLELKDKSVASNSPVFITIENNLTDRPREFVSVNNNAFSYREDMSRDGIFVFELNDPKNPETLIFEYKDGYYCDRDLTATLTTADKNVVAPEPLKYGELYQAG